MKAVSSIVSFPAPIKGWNVRDPLPSMSPEYAPILDNVFCLPSEIQVRKGWSSWATGFTGNVESLATYYAATGSEKVFAGVNNAGACSLYDVTTSGAVGAAAVSGLTAATFKSCSFATTGGFFSYFVNGADNARTFDGTTWTNVSVGSGASQISGPASTIFVDVISHKRRLWFVPVNSLKVWYLPTDQLYGTAASYDFSPIFKKGGKIVKLDTWSIDAGEGLDDYFVVFTSTGEVAVYEGVDPASMSTWSLKGVFYIGAPVGNPGYTCKYGGDLLLLNRDGIAQMSQSLMSSRVSAQIQLTDKIQPQLASDTLTYASNSGWEILLYPPENMLVVNVPISTTASYQYVMNTISGAWSRWTGIPAKCLAFANDKLFFGGANYVGRMWDTQADSGAYITADILPAYQNFGRQSQLKRWSLARVVIGADGPASYGARMEVDFNTNPSSVNLPSATGTAASVYGTGRYGSAVYGGAISIQSKWKNVTGIGHWGSLHVQVKTNTSDVRVYSCDVVMETGGTI